MFRSIYLVVSLCIGTTLLGQTGPGIGLYPTGTEAGFGLRSSKETRWALDTRITRANLYSESTKASTFVTEVSAIYRVVKLEKVRFHLGAGYRVDWNFSDTHKHGLVVPVGGEAFPFPFQNAGLIFEVAPFCVTDLDKSTQIGVRTVAGFVFYFPRKTPTPTQP